MTYPTSTGGGWLNFTIGAACWHVTGFVNSDVTRPVRLCGTTVESVLGGNAYDVLRSGMPVCRNCDRAAAGAASSEVEMVRMGSAP